MTRCRELPLPPPSADLEVDGTRPYFIWWADVTVGRFKELLRSTDRETRAYWTAALLREANSRDVWLFVTPDEVRELWPALIRYVGRSRDMWAWLLGLPKPVWPPPEAGRG